MIGIVDILEAVVAKVPPPTADRALTLRALIFDSWFDPYQGVVTLVRVMDGSVKKGDRIKFMATDKEYEVLKLGVFAPFAAPLDQLDAARSDSSSRASRTSATSRWVTP